MDDQEERKENCLLVLDGLDEQAINDALCFSDENQRLAKLRDGINAKLLRDLRRLKSFVQEPQ